MILRLWPILRLEQIVFVVSLLSIAALVRLAIARFYSTAAWRKLPEPTIGSKPGAEFLSDWEYRYAQVRKARRSGALALWISVFSVVYEAPQYLNSIYDGAKISANVATAETILHLSPILSFELTLCMIVYCCAVYLDDTMIIRRERWRITAGQRLARTKKASETSLEP